MTAAVYALNAKHQWVEVKLPTDAYVETIKRLSHVSDLRSGKGYGSPKKWLADGRLLLEFCSRDIFYEGEELEKAFAICLQVTGKSDAPLRVARIVSIRLEPRQSPSN